jgi:hypothetical protein
VGSVNQDGFKLHVTYQPVTYADDVDIGGERTYCKVKRRTFGSC